MNSPFLCWVWFPRPHIRFGLSLRPSGSNEQKLIPCTQCTDATNKTRRTIFMIRRSIQANSKLAFLPLYGSLVRPHLEYGMQTCPPHFEADTNHLEQFPRLATRLVTGFRHSPYEERLQRLDLHSTHIAARHEETRTACCNIIQKVIFSLYISLCH